MADLSKKDLENIKEAVIDVLEPFAQATQLDFQKVNEKLDNVDSRLGSVENRLDGVENRLDGVENRLGNLETDVKWMKENSSELFTKLDKFITLYEKHEQELVIMAGQLRRLEERVAKLEKQ